MAHIRIGSRDSDRDERANVAAVVRAENARRDMLSALHAGDEGRAHEADRIAEAAVNECYERAMDRAASLDKAGDPRGELARANRQLIERSQGRRQGYQR